MPIFKFRNLKTGQATPIGTGEYTIGRDPEADITVDDSSVSRHHARLLNNADGYFLEDLSSANGVALQGEYLSGRIPIQLGDLIHIGKVPFRVDPEVPTEERPAGKKESDDEESETKDVAKQTAVPAAVVEHPAVDPLPIEDPPFTPTPAALSASPSTVEPAPIRAHETTKSGVLVRHSVPLPRLVQLIATPTEPPPAPEPPPPVPAAPAAPTPAAQPPVSVATPLVPAPLPAPTVIPAAAASDVAWWWWLIIFLAGFGSGLLLGLYFAKVFLEMGGKPLSLPG